jgi:uncharacterized membrane protein YqjE
VTILSLTVTYAKLLRVIRTTIAATKFATLYLLGVMSVSKNGEATVVLYVDTLISCRWQLRKLSHGTTIDTYGNVNPLEKPSLR